jgi:calcineurin-like phosphoesterase family protein
MRVKIDIAQGQDVFFISDFHLFHKNVINFDNRPFRDELGNPDVEAMHETIKNNWNSVVKASDVVFYLGDLCFANAKNGEEFMKELNGKIYFVMGNHDDYRDIIKNTRYAGVYDIVDLYIYDSSKITEKKKSVDELHFVLSHYPIYSYNKMHAGAIHVHGHTHGSLHHGEPTTFDYYANRKAIDVGCNMQDYTPVSYKTILKKFS